jgi:pilus assembly protein Flp/PilA
VFGKENPVRSALNAIRRRRDEGASAVEYGLLVALVAVVIAATVVTLGVVLKNKFEDACNAVANQPKTTTVLQTTPDCTTN